MVTDRVNTPGPGRRGGWCAVCLPVVAALFFVATASAGEPGYYSGGKFHPLIVSQDEFAVELAEPAQRQESAVRARSIGLGTLEDVPWGEPHGQFAILRVASDAPAVRARVRNAPEYKSVNRVYRLAENAQPILSSGRIVVKFRADVSADERTAVYAAYRVREVQMVAGLDNTFLVEPVGGVDDVELDTANALYRDTRTVYAHPDMRFPVVKKQVSSGDTFASSHQWYLESVGQLGASGDADIDLNDAWRRTLGATVLFGQLDDACDVHHEDFQDVLADNYIGVSHNIADNSQSVDAAVPTAAGERHGTSTMGIICARTGNGVGITGIAPNADFTASRGVSSQITTSQIASAYTFARNQGVDVHNNSWGFGPSTPNPDVVVDAIDTAFMEGRDDLGIVVCFASGSGQGMESTAPLGDLVEGDDELSTLPSVIGVGASNARDELSAYSNYGPEIDVLAPSNDLESGGSTLPAITTTDNTDSEFPFEPGYNDNGFSDDGSANLADPNYTNNFGGTSASSAIVSGIAGLILALEPDYTATQVRNIIEHTCDQIDDTVAAYSPVTSRSLRYGYGRVNAGRAVESTFDGFYWPERAANVEVDVAENTIRWEINDDIRTKGEAQFGVPTVSVLVVESDEDFAWKPTDGVTYVTGQTVSPGVRVGANLLAEVFTYTASSETKHFGIYTVAFTSRRGYTYGFGVKATSDGTVLDSGVTFDSNVIVTPPGRPSVTIDVSPLSGTSPLIVQFEGNAQSNAMVTSYLWDFGDGTTSSQRVTEHTYTVTSGTQRFFTSLTVTDANGATGVAAVAIDVSAEDTGNGNGGGTGGSVSIRIAQPQSPDSDISSGFAPLNVVLSAEVSGINTATQDLSVFWDLGDGNTSDSLSVAHTYQIAGRFPISVQIESESLTEPLQNTRFLDVFSTATPTPTPTATPDNGNGDGSGGVCGIGATAAIWMGAMLLIWRRLAR